MNKQTIISFIDDSKYCDIVCEYSALLAKNSGSKIKLYHILKKEKKQSKTDLSGSINLGAKTKLLENLVNYESSIAKIANEKGWKVLENAKKKILESGNFNVEIRLRTGEITQALKEKEHDGDIIVIGKRGEIKQNIDKKLGANFESIVRSSNKPIFVANRSFGSIKNILIAFDGSQPTLKLIDFFQKQNFFLNCKISLIYINDGKKKNFFDVNKQIQLDKPSKLDIELQEFNGQPKVILADLVKSKKFDLLAIGAYGHSKVRSLLLGSTTSELIKNNRIPFLLMR